MKASAFCAELQTAEKQVWELYRDTVDGLADNYALLAEVIDLEDSEAWKEGTATAFRTDDTELVLEHQPAAVPMNFSTISPNADGLYKLTIR